MVDGRPEISSALDDTEEIALTVPVSFQGQRLDLALTSLMPACTRGTIQGWMKNGHILLDGQRVKPSDKVRGIQTLIIRIPAERPEQWDAEDIQLDIVYEDPHLIVINKPAGLVVHPGAGNTGGTLMNGLLAYDPGLRGLPRAGIVHRLDKDTTGLMVVARSELARQSLIEQLKKHTVSRHYTALANGCLITGETIDQPIGRHRHDRLRMAVTGNGKPAITHIRLLQKYRAHTLLEARLETGRTHQIRVHLAWRGFPLVGDPVYGGKPRPLRGAGERLLTLLMNFNRQALHAKSLCLEHPSSGKTLRWQCEMPADMLELIAELDRNEPQTRP